MAISGETRKRRAAATGVRGLVLLPVGHYAVVLSIETLAGVVLPGGMLFVIEGALGRWSLTFGGAKRGNYWFAVYLVAIQAIFVGVMEISVAIRERELYDRIWPVILNGVLYVLFGIALALSPMIVATVLVIFAGVLAIRFAIGLFALARRMYQASKGTA